jgi:hypothetical protein
MLVLDCREMQQGVTTVLHPAWDLKCDV